MRMCSARVLALGFSGVLAWSAVSEASVMSLKAVKRNGAAITPTSSLNIVPGDTIEVDIVLSAWSVDLPGGVKNYQVTLDGTGFASGGNGTVLPVGWKAPLAQLSCTPPNTCQGGLNAGNACTTNADCPGSVCGTASCVSRSVNHPFCLSSFGGSFCVGSGHNPSLGAQINTGRSDFIFFGESVIADINTTSLYYNYFAIRDPAGGVPDTGAAKYLATLIVQASSNACGTFSLRTTTDTTAFISDDAAPPNQAFPTPQALMLTIQPGDCIRQVVSCNFGHTGQFGIPTHCDIDARIPHDRNNAGSFLTTNQVVFTYDRSTAGMTAADFEVTKFGTDVGPTSLTAVPAGNNVTVTLNRRVRPSNWYCVRDKAADRRCCIGSLPGDPEWNLSSNFDDVFELLANFDGTSVPPRIIQQCDIDRSALCAPADLVMAVDMLVGTGAFDVYNGATLQECPPPTK